MLWSRWELRERFVRLKTLNQALLGRQPKHSTKGDFEIAQQIFFRFAFLNPSLYCIYFTLFKFINC
ncbi:hypothetical protein C1H46_045142 [Malus baccata]|uniref:Uncharacterized protein n=1 Tax=Malus baccata TaxID=106549 RepID=A0A540K522_MALBA|nr:hypothetical protein C1H46_045142 [Malus baccata]